MTDRHNDDGRPTWKVSLKMCYPVKEPPPVDCVAPEEFLAELADWTKIPQMTQS